MAGISNAQRLDGERRHRLASVAARAAKNTGSKPDSSLPKPAGPTQLAEVGASNRLKPVGVQLGVRADSHPDLSHRAINAAVVIDLDGQRWTRLPDAWAASADLCGWVETYAYDGDWLVARCRRRSAWACGDSGRCARHFRDSLRVGA